MSIVKDLCFSIPILIFILFICLKYYLLKKNFIKERNYFINTLSHDLRVAVIAQLRGLDLLKKYTDTHPETNALINDINNSTEYSLDIINLLINNYKFEDGINTLKYEIFDLSKEIITIYNKLYTYAKEKNITINNYFENCFVNGDKSELIKCIFILISTSICQSKQGTGINCYLKENNNTIIFETIYQGKKLSCEEQKRMFDKDSRFSTVGHGIKMHYCKKISDFHKGKLELISTNEGNNIFRLIIPTNIKQKQIRSLKTCTLIA